MFVFEAYETMPVSSQMLHLVHFMLCSFAVLVGVTPLITEKGSIEHKFGGGLYVPLATAAFVLASAIAWIENSVLLLCFNAFCAYLLLSGWRAMHAKEMPNLIDWALPGGLLFLATFVTAHSLMYDEGMANLYMLFFALNAYVLVWRDWQFLKNRISWVRYKRFMPDYGFDAPGSDWLSRHVTGMVGSMIANLSVVVLTLLPLELHWLWPAALVLASMTIALRRQMRHREVKKAMAPVLRPKFNARGKQPAPAGDDDIRRAA